MWDKMDLEVILILLSKIVNPSLSTTHLIRRLIKIFKTNRIMRTKLMDKKINQRMKLIHKI